MGWHREIPPAQTLTCSPTPPGRAPEGIYDDHPRTAAEMTGSQYALVRSTSRCSAKSAHQPSMRWCARSRSAVLMLLSNLRRRRTGRLLLGAGADADGGILTGLNSRTGVPRRPVSTSTSWIWRQRSGHLAVKTGVKQSLRRQRWRVPVDGYYATT